MPPSLFSSRLRLPWSPMRQISAALQPSAIPLLERAAATTPHSPSPSCSLLSCDWQGWFFWPQGDLVSTPWIWKFLAQSGWWHILRLHKALSSFPFHSGPVPDTIIAFICLPMTSPSVLRVFSHWWTTIERLPSLTMWMLGSTLGLLKK